MGENKNQSNILMWSARIGGAIVSIFWIFSLLTSGISESMDAKLSMTLEGLLLTILVIASAVGVGISWKYPLNGGKITVISSLFLGIFAYFSSGHNHLFAVSISGLPFFLVGILFIQSHQAKQDSI